jgi:hypothetical protein
MNYIEKKALRQRIISELKNRGIEDIGTVLDAIDFDSLIDSQLSYEENLENVIREIGIFLSDNHYRNMREIERIANNMKIDLENGIIIKYSPDYEDREYINLEDDSLTFNPLCIETRVYFGGGRMTDVNFQSSLH